PRRDPLSFIPPSLPPPPTSTLFPYTTLFRSIRRAFVPADLMDAVAEAASERLAKVTVGNPSAEGVRMGALASLEQREEVRRSLKALTSVADVVFGDPQHVDVVDADAERGAFVSPVLLKVSDPELREPHQVEAFGPVSTLILYTATY